MKRTGLFVVAILGFVATLLYFSRDDADANSTIKNKTEKTPGVQIPQMGAADQSGKLGKPNPTEPAAIDRRAEEGDEIPAEKTLDHSVFGKVIHGDSGEPFVAAMVRLICRDKVLETRSDKQGAFSFKDVPIGRYQYYAHAADLVSIESFSDLPEFRIYENIPSVGPLTLG